MRQLKISKNITNRETRSLELHFQEISKIKQLSVEEEDTLVKIASKINRNTTERENAIEELATRNMRFVVSVAKKYQGLGLSLSDLISEGHIGNLKAARRFDHSRGFRFISYSVWWIRQAIISAINETGRTIRIPQNKIVEESKLRRMNIQLSQELERTPTIYELAEGLGFSLETVLSSFSASKRVSELDAPLKTGIESSSTLGEILSIEDELKTDAALEYESLITDIESMLSVLVPRDVEILRLCYGLKDFNKKKRRSMTLEEIGSRFDLTRERVRQIRNNSLEKLRKHSYGGLVKEHLN